MILLCYLLELFSFRESGVFHKIKENVLQVGCQKEEILLLIQQLYHASTRYPYAKKSPHYFLFNQKIGILCLNKNNSCKPKKISRAHFLIHDAENMCAFYTKQLLNNKPISEVSIIDNLEFSILQKTSVKLLPVF